MNERKSRRAYKAQHDTPGYHKVTALNLFEPFDVAPHVNDLPDLRSALRSLLQLSRPRLNLMPRALRPGRRLGSARIFSPHALSAATRRIWG